MLGKKRRKKKDLWPSYSVSDTLTGSGNTVVAVVFLTPLTADSIRDGVRGQFRLCEFIGWAAHP